MLTIKHIPCFQSHVNIISLRIKFYSSNLRLIRFLITVIDSIFRASFLGVNIYLKGSRERQSVYVYIISSSVYDVV